MGQQGIRDLARVFHAIPYGEGQDRDDGTEREELEHIRKGNRLDTP